MGETEDDVSLGCFRSTVVEVGPAVSRVNPREGTLGSSSEAYESPAMEEKIASSIDPSTPLSMRTVAVSRSLADTIMSAEDWGGGILVAPGEADIVRSIACFDVIIIHFYRSCLPLHDSTVQIEG